MDILQTRPPRPKFLDLPVFVNDMITTIEKCPDPPQTQENPSRYQSLILNEFAEEYDYNDGYTIYFRDGAFARNTSVFESFLEKYKEIWIPVGYVIRKIERFLNKHFGEKPKGVWIWLTLLIFHHIKIISEMGRSEMRCDTFFFYWGTVHISPSGRQVESEKAFSQL